MQILEEQVKGIKGVLQENVDKAQETARMLQLKTEECTTRAEQIESGKRESAGLQQRLQDAATECAQKLDIIAGLKAQLESKDTLHAASERELGSIKSQLEKTINISDTLAKDRSALLERVNALEHQLSSSKKGAESDSELMTKIADLEAKLSTALRDAADWQQRDKRHVAELVATKKQLCEFQANSRVATP